MPVTFWTFVIASLSLAGIPPLAGFWSKDAILLGAWEEGAYLPLAVALLTAFLTAFYMFRCIYLTFFGAPRWDTGDAADVHTTHVSHGGHGHGGHPTPHESPWTMALPLAIIAIPAISAGWLGMPGIYAPFEEAIRFGPLVEEHFNVWLAIAGTLAGLLGIGLATVMYLRPVIGPRLLGEAFPDTYRVLLNKYYFDEMYQWLIDRVVLGIAAMAATIDRKVVNNTFIDAPGPIFSTLGEWLRQTATGRVQHYAVGFVLGIVVVGAVFAGLVPDLRVALW
jgi:NADH-quinone oxidoreductase subunit L